MEKEIETEVVWKKEKTPGHDAITNKHIPRYLGQIISLKNKIEKETDRQTKPAWSKFWSLKYGGTSLIT